MTEKSFGAAELGQQLMVNYHKRVWKCHKLAKHNQSRIKHRNLIKTKKWRGWRRWLREENARGSSMRNSDWGSSTLTKAGVDGKHLEPQLGGREGDGAILGLLARQFIQNGELQVQ